jgi:hypothetical protein
MSHFYILRKRSKTTELFKNTQHRVTFCTKYTINNILNPHAQTDKYCNSVIYQMKCLDCKLNYVGQTGRTSNIRYKENTHAIRSNNGKSGYWNHILNTEHTYGTITDPMDVITTERKGRHLRKHIYKISTNNLHMNDTYIKYTIRYSKEYMNFTIVSSTRATEKDN